MLAVQDLERGDVQQQPAARLQHARDLGDRRPLDLVGQTLKDVERGDQIEGAAAKGMSAMLACATVCPCVLANRTPVAVRSKPTALP